MDETSSPVNPAQAVKIEKPVYEKGEIRYLNEYAGELANNIFNGTKTMKPDKKLVFDGQSVGNIQFQSGNYALIYKGDTPVRIIPFLWQQDVETRQSWAVFRARDFYNSKPPLLVWKRLRIPIIIIPFDKSKYSCDYYAHGYLAKFSEESLRQLSVHKNEDEAEVAKGMKDLRMVSQNLALYRMLSKYLSSKWNWVWIAVIVGIGLVGAFIAYMLHAHPQWISSLTNSIHIGTLNHG